MSSPTSSPDSNRVGVRYVSDAVKHDHRSLEKLYAALAADTGGPCDPDLQRRFCWELGRHLVAMNLFIFPGTTRRASQGNQNAMGRQADFAVLRDGLLGLHIHMHGARGREGEEGAGGDGGDAGFREALGRLKVDLVRHIREVERTDMVAIEKVLSGEESERLASDFGATVYFIPPEVRAGPDGKGDVRAPFGSLEGLLDASVGELMEVLEGFPRD